MYTWELKLELATVPDKPNKNGYIYSCENFNNAIQKYYTEQIKNNTGFITLGYNDPADLTSSNIIGHVKSVDVDTFSAIILTETYYDPESFCLGMNYMAEILYDNRVFIENIINFVILPKNNAYIIR